MEDGQFVFVGIDDGKVVDTWASEYFDPHCSYLLKSIETGQLRVIQFVDGEPVERYIEEIPVEGN